MLFSEVGLSFILPGIRSATYRDSARACETENQGGCEPAGSQLQREIRAGRGARLLKEETDLGTLSVYPLVDFPRI
jgi:hypothetical protein